MYDAVTGLLTTKYQLVVYDPLGDGGGPATCAASTTQLENVKNNVAPA